MSPNKLKLLFKGLGDIRTFKARGIVIKDFIDGESDKVIICLVFEYGKLRVRVRGGAKTGSKFHASSRLFAYSDFVIFDGGGFYSLTQCDVLYPFGKIAESYENICYASYIAELTEKTLLEGETCDDILNLLLYCLKAIGKGRMDLKLLKAVYEFKFMQLCGFTPVLDGDCECGASRCLHFSEQGLICAACANGRAAVIISETAVYALKYVFAKGVKEIFSFSLPLDAQDGFITSSGIFLRAHCDARTKSARLLE